LIKNPWTTEVVVLQKSLPAIIFGYEK